MSGWYVAIMDSSRNPLRNLPPAQRFQVMVFLSVMWTTIFCAVGGLWFYYGELIIGHVLLALGVLVTATIFRRAGLANSARQSS